MNKKPIFLDHVEAWTRASYGHDLFELDLKHYALLPKYGATTRTLSRLWLKRRIVRTRIDIVYEEVSYEERALRRSGLDTNVYEQIGLQLAGLCGEDLHGPISQILHSQPAGERQYNLWREGDHYEAVIGGWVRMCYLGVPPRTLKDFYRWKDFLDGHPPIPFCGFESISLTQLVQRIHDVDRQILTGLGVSGSVVPHGSLGKGETPSSP